MEVREKLAQFLKESVKNCDPVENCLTCRYRAEPDCMERITADYMIAHGVTVQEHGYWETVVEVRDNTVCGNGAKIEYKRCSRCKNPAKFFEDDFCGHCGAKLDLPHPTKGK